jgi:hypothetical protein
MDTTTVLQIISMLDTRINTIYHIDMPEIQSSDDALPWQYDNLSGACLELMNFRDHLQGFIEAEVNYAENALQGGE